MPEAQHKITPEDLLPIVEYDQQRKSLKANLIPMKRQHRIEVPSIEQTISGDKDFPVAAYRIVCHGNAYRKLAISPSSADFGGRMTDSGSCPSGSSTMFS